MRGRAAEGVAVCNFDEERNHAIARRRGGGFAAGDRLFISEVISDGPVVQSISWTYYSLLTLKIACLVQLRQKRDLLWSKLHVDQQISGFQLKQCT
jgi:hypothetical protein